MGVVLLRETQSLWVYSGNALICTAMMSFMGPIFGYLSDRFGRTRTAATFAAFTAIWALCAWWFYSVEYLIPIALLTSFFTCATASCLGVVSISTPGLQASKGNAKATGVGLSKIQVGEQIARIAAPMMLLLFKTAQPTDSFGFHMSLRIV